MNTLPYPVYATCPSDVPPDLDVTFLADRIVQDRGFYEIPYVSPELEVAAEAITQMATATALAERLLRDRWRWAPVALFHGMPLAAVAASVGLTVEQTTTMLAATSPRRECIDCGHEFNPDSSPHEDRCWECAEQADAQAGALL